MWKIICCLIVNNHSCSPKVITTFMSKLWYHMKVLNLHTQGILYGVYWQQNSNRTSARVVRKNKSADREAKRTSENVTFNHRYIADFFYECITFSCRWFQDDPNFLTMEPFSENYFSVPRHFGGMTLLFQKVYYVPKHFGGLNTCLVISIIPLVKDWRLRADMNLRVSNIKHRKYILCK